MVIDEALIAETMVWPNFFLMNVFFALKGSKLFVIIYKTAVAIDRCCFVKYTNDHICETASPISVKFVAKCSSIQLFSFQMKVDLCERIPLKAHFDVSMM